MFPVKVESRENTRVAGVAHTGDYRQIGDIYSRLLGIATEYDVWPHVCGAIAIYYDNPDEVPQEKLRSFAGLKINANADLPNVLNETLLEKGRYAVLTYKGPYEELERAYDYFFGEWFPQSGETAQSAFIYESYLNNPQEVPPSELLTEICVPLK